MTRQIGALVLAAGRSSRMGGNKLLESVGGKPMIRHAVGAALGSSARPVLVVTGNESGLVRAALDGMGPLSFADNPDYSKGLSTSLVLGLNSLPPGLDGILVLLGDMPGVDAALLDHMIAAFDPQAGRSIIVATHEGRRGNPVLWAARHFDAMRGLTGDAGARSLMAGNEVEIVALEAGTAAVKDLDTPEDLAAWRAHIQGPGQP